MTSFFMMGAQEAVGEENQLIQLGKLIHLNDIHPQGAPREITSYRC